MLKALLAEKLNDEFVRSPYSIEDLLTSVVLGTCSYLPPHVALLPFLSRARMLDGSLLADQLEDVEAVDAVFWPFWDAVDRPIASVGGAEPDLLLRLTHRDGQRSLLVVEAKLLSGKSSLPTSDTRVTDQLGKYWVHLLRQAALLHARALGIVYLTAGLATPLTDFEQTQGELRAKAAPAAPLYWLSWRHFVGCVASADGGPMLADLIKLLSEQWALTEIVMRPWPAAPRGTSSWRFDPSWRWPAPVLSRTDWDFDVSWTWPVRARVTGKWVYDTGRKR